MVFLFILLKILLVILLITFIVISCKIQIQICDLKINSQISNIIDKSYKYILKIYVFNIIPIIKINITEEKIKKIEQNKQLMEKFKKEKIKILKDKNKIDKEILNKMKKLKIKIQKINLDIIIGTENAAITALLIPAISTILSISLRNKIAKNKKNYFSIQPKYINQNLIKINLKCIFEIKMIHIIFIIYIINKKRKGDKYERTSNRRTYDYGYE